jgi:hypothetical protein
MRARCKWMRTKLACFAILRTMRFRPSRMVTATRDHLQERDIPSAL